MERPRGATPHGVTPRGVTSRGAPTHVALAPICKTPKPVLDLLPLKSKSVPFQYKGDDAATPATHGDGVNPLDGSALVSSDPSPSAAQANVSSAPLKQLQRVERALPVLVLALLVVVLLLFDDDVGADDDGGSGDGAGVASFARTTTCEA